MERDTTRKLSKKVDFKKNSSSISFVGEKEYAYRPSKVMYGLKNKSCKGSETFRADGRAIKYKNNECFEEKELRFDVRKIKYKNQECKEERKLKADCRAIKYKNKSVVGQIVYKQKNKGDTQKVIVLEESYSAV